MLETIVVVLGVLWLLVLLPRPPWVDSFISSWGLAIVVIVIVSFKGAGLATFDWVYATAQRRRSGPSLSALSLD